MSGSPRSRRVICISPPDVQNGSIRNCETIMEGLQFLCLKVHEGMNGCDEGYALNLHLNVSVSRHVCHGSDLQGNGERVLFDESLPAGIYKFWVLA